MKYLAIFLSLFLSPIGWTKESQSPPPLLVSPADDSLVQNAGGDVWTFSWQPIEGVSRYNIQVTPRKSKTPLVDVEVSGTAYEFRLNENAPVGKKQLKRWTWQVRAFDGEWGPWSKKRKFNVMSHQDTTNLRCYGNVQDLIAWDYNGSIQWDEASLQKLCDGTPDPFQPGACFERVMHGGINWGAGTRWQTEYALNLCQKSANADQTIGCFQHTVNMRVPWAEAIEQCANNR